MNHGRGNRFLTEQPREGEKGAFNRVISETNDLSEAIKEFLEFSGIEVNRIQNGGYQVKANGQTIRFYIFGQKEMGRPKPPDASER